jgi:hypothetical protein
MNTTESGQVPGPRARMALQAIRGEATRGVPSWLLNVMEHRVIERLAGVEPGAYVQRPEAVYLAMQRSLGTCMIDQWIPRNPLSMGDAGYESDQTRSATQGAPRIVVDDMLIDGPESVVEHMQRFNLPRWQARIDAFDREQTVRRIIDEHEQTQRLLGSDILKAPYNVVQFPRLDYSKYGYEAYFMAYALYPEIIDQHWDAQTRLALLHNEAAAEAYRRGRLPPLCRMDHDMADSRGTLVDIRTLEQRWFPRLARCVEPALKAGVRLIWHCDGNLMAMVPRLIDCGISGFQGFQYEDGMDYAAICRMKSREGGPLLIIAGVSVTRTLPHGSPEDVRRELRFLVEHGPREGLFLGGSSSIAPGTPVANILALAQGLRHYQADAQRARCG